MVVNYVSAAVKAVDSDNQTASVATAHNGFRSEFSGPDGLKQFEVRYSPLAANYLRVQPAMTTSAPCLSAQGDDTNINLAYAAKGTGYHVFGNSYGVALKVSDSGLGGITANFLSITGGTPQGPVRLYLGSHSGDADIHCELRRAGAGQWKIGGLTSVDNRYEPDVSVIAGIATGYSHTLPDTGYTNYVYKPAAGLATLTVTMPANPVAGQIVCFSTTQTITTFNILANTSVMAQTVIGSPGVIYTTTPLKFVWLADHSYWVRAA
jgi:hypothetical protein